MGFLMEFLFYKSFTSFYLLSMLERRRNNASVCTLYCFPLFFFCNVIVVYFYSLLEGYIPVPLFFVMFLINECMLKYMGFIALFLFFTVVLNWVSRTVEFHWYWY